MRIKDFITIIGASVLAILLFTGCASIYRGGQVNDGTIVQAGFKIPLSSTDTTTTLQLMNYVNGLQMSWESNSNVHITRRTVVTTDFCSLYTNTTSNTTEIVVDRDYSHE